jgi:phage gp29-like protein
MVDRLGREGEAYIEAMYARVLRELEASADMEEAQSRVLELYPELDGADYARLLGNSFMTAELRGRQAADRG